MIEVGTRVAVKTYLGLRIGTVVNGGTKSEGNKWDYSTVYSYECLVKPDDKLDYCKASPRYPDTFCFITNTVCILPDHALPENNSIKDIV
jgi:hypothetical protein